MATEQLPVRPFAWQDWRALWQLRYAQLAEDGIHVDPREMPEAPQDTPRGSYEWDIDHMEQIYLSGAGGFWLAWQGETAVGMVGAQDLGGVVELRRMHVRRDCRRRGVGRQLVQALIDHCRDRGASAIELWTALDGPGRSLYSRLGFRPVSAPGPGYEDVDDATGRSPSASEIRMRLEMI